MRVTLYDADCTGHESNTSYPHQVVVKDSATFLSAIAKDHEYQTYASQFIDEHPVSAIFLDMGLGKTVLTLTSIFDLLYDYFLVSRVLVIAPLRVARDTWPEEIQKWDHLHLLSYAVAVGSEKQRKEAIRQNADITIINRENVTCHTNQRSPVRTLAVQS